MPIRINLLAEQLAAEELRRRDPVKRALYAGGGLVVLMIFWIGITHMNLKAAESELEEYSARLRKVEDASKELRQHQGEINQIRNKIQALDKYADNRFFWGTFLDSLQHVAVEDLRLMEVRGEHLYSTNNGSKLWTTNVVVAGPSKPPFWKFWASARAAEPHDKAVATALASVTNRGVFLTNQIAFKYKATTVSTNDQGITTKVEFTTLPWAMERIMVELRGRDYGKRPGEGIDTFTEKLSESSFYKEWLTSGDGYRFTERPPQPRADALDPMNPGALYVPFTIECRLKDRYFTHE